MTNEDALRRLLQQHAATVEPRGDGLSLIRERIARRRTVLRWLPVAAVAAAAALVVVVASNNTGSRPALPAHRPGPASVKQSSAPAPPPTETGTTTSAAGLPIWPVTTDRAAARWRANPQSRSWGGDPEKVSAHFAADFLHLPGLVAGTKALADGAADVPLLSGGRRIALVHLVRVGGHSDSPWAVTGSTSATLSIRVPADEAAVSSPLAVTGRVIGVDESVVTSLVTESGHQLAVTHTGAGSALPWRTSLVWQDTAWSVAALASVTFSAKDGSPSAVVVTAVSRYTGQ